MDEADEADMRVREDRLNEAEAGVAETRAKAGSRDEEARALPPDEVAEALSISQPRLRRYAADYEGVFEPLPRHEGRRVFSPQALGRLEAAQALIRLGVMPSLKDALQRVRDEPGLVRMAGLGEDVVAAESTGVTGDTGADEEKGSSPRGDADKPDAQATPTDPPPEARLEPGGAGAKKNAEDQGLRLTLHLTKGGWELVAAGGADESERLLTLFEALVRAAGLETPG